MYNSGSGEWQLLLVRMFQNEIGVAEPVTAEEVRYEVDVTDFHGSIEMILQTMAANGLVEESTLALPDSKTGSKRRLRLTKEYQVCVEALEALI